MRRSGAALDAGDLLTMAKARLPHGGWAEWLGRLGLKARTASTWMRLASMGLTAEDVIDRGGINATLKGGGKSASVADSSSRSDLQRELEDAEQQIQDTKAAYYAALTARHRALRALAHQLATTDSTETPEPPEFPVYYDAQGNEHAEF